MGARPSTRVNLLSLFAAQAQPICQRQVPGVIGFPQVSQQPPALPHQHQQTSPAGFIMFVRTKMVGEVEDAAGEKSDLNIG